jgi:hypothetical protein
MTRGHLLKHQMDCRVKPGNNAGGAHFRPVRRKGGDWRATASALSCPPHSEDAMKSSTIARALLLGGLVCGILVPSCDPAAAADLKLPKHNAVTSWRYSAPTPGLPFPRGKRAESVWAADACWRACGAHCAWDMTGCLSLDTQGHCLKLTDSCDRSCQSACRTRGGPLLSLDY